MLGVQGGCVLQRGARGAALDGNAQEGMRGTQSSGAQAAQHGGRGRGRGGGGVTDVDRKTTSPNIAPWRHIDTTNMQCVCSYGPAAHRVSLCCVFFALPIFLCSPYPPPASQRLFMSAGWSPRSRAPSPPPGARCAA